MASFYDEFCALFVDDARAQGWIGATDGSGLLVLDEHDLLYAYGPLDAFSSRLRATGFIPGEPRAPDPHEHHYNEEFDPLEQRLRAWSRWQRVLPLGEDED